MWKCFVCGLLPLYGVHFQGLFPGRESRMSPLAMMYLIRGSRLAASSSVILLMSTPFAGSCVTSMACTTPFASGL
jgi:hypothetical protein